MRSQKALRGVRRRLLSHAVTHQAVGIVLARYPRTDVAAALLLIKNASQQHSLIPHQPAAALITAPAPGTEAVVLVPGPAPSACPAPAIPHL